MLRDTSAQSQHKKLIHFVNRLDSDLTKEAEFFKSGVGKVASLAPVIDES